MTADVEMALQIGTKFLADQQQSSGCFQGQLSSMTFPTCAYAWTQFAMGNQPENSIINWILDNQDPNGMWSLDASAIPNDNATLFAQLILQQIQKVKPDSKVQEALNKIPPLSINLGLIKLAYAHCGSYQWNRLTPPKFAIPMIKIAQQLAQAFPNLRTLLKPPKHLLPTPDFFYSDTFNNLFIAEQQTLVPAMLLLELEGQKRAETINDLFLWVQSKMLSNGSWFCVNYITALATIALIEYSKYSADSQASSLIKQSQLWLEQTRNPDGGYREAINLNIWDTSLSLIALAETRNPNYKGHILEGTKWLAKHQSKEGGWAFSGLLDGGLPCDADDTALAILALLKSGFPISSDTIQNGLNWLMKNQSIDGSWSTYIPGEGDVGCVSITAHAIEVLLEVDGYQKQVDQAVTWLETQISRDGFWDDLWLSKRTYGTACAISAIVKAGYNNIQAIKDGIKWLESAQNPDGGWGEDMFGNQISSTVEQTAWSTYALLIADHQNLSARRGLEFLTSQQNSDGSWNASCVGIYWEIIGGYIDPIYASVFPILALNAYHHGENSTQN